MPHIQPLPEAELPDWNRDIKPFLFEKKASDRAFKAARRAYDKLRTPDSELTFAQFAEILEGELTAL